MKFSHLVYLLSGLFCYGVAGGLETERLGFSDALRYILIAGAVCLLVYAGEKLVTALSPHIKVSFNRSLRAFARAYRRRRAVQMAKAARKNERTRELATGRGRLERT